MHLDHNPHTAYYETVAQYESTLGDSCCDWVSEEERILAIRTNDFWRLQWYPDTPIGSFTLAAHNLNVLLEIARQTTRDD